MHDLTLNADSIGDDSSPPPFFIVGSGRSGSTLLRMMLASHSRIVIPPETWFLLPLIEQLPIDRVLAKDEVEKAIAIMTSHYRWPDLKISTEELREKAHRLKDARIADLAQIVYRFHAMTAGKIRWGDKTPPYVRIVPQLSAMFPGARFIYLVRDGRDVTKSFQSLKIYGLTIHQNTIEWLVANRWERKWATSEYAGAILRVHYEELIRNSERTLREICRFIGEDFEPQMLAWQKSVEDMVPKRELHVHQKLKRPSNFDDIERWKREMSSREIFVAEAFIGRDLRRLGYARRFQSLLWKPVLWLTRLYCNVVWRLLPEWAVSAVTRFLHDERGAGADKVVAPPLSEGGSGLPDNPVQAAPGAVDPSEGWWKRFRRR